MKAHRRVSREELKHVPRPVKFHLTRFDGEVMWLEFFHNDVCFARDMIWVTIGGKKSCIQRDEILRYLTAAYPDHKEKDLYSEQDMENMSKENYCKPLNPKYIVKK
jgi:hypothetical protein